MALRLKQVPTPTGGSSPAMPTAPMRASEARAAQTYGVPLMLTPIVLAGLIIIYIVWMAVEQHKRLQESIQPRAIGLSMRNIVAILFPVILGLVILKVLAIKLAAVWPNVITRTFALIINAA